MPSLGGSQRDKVMGDDKTHHFSLTPDHQAFTGRLPDRTSFRNAQG
ncbi:MAG: hypothetical protein JXB07_11950 [Anaerolineae bacterium]|nr:hypothetical protein [Anaerolineae bacterium]